VFAIAYGPQGTSQSFLLSDEAPGHLFTNLVAAGYPSPLLKPWTATVGGKNAAVGYAGSAPDNIAGLFQVNVQIPADLTTGIYDRVIKAGNFASPAGLTVAVK
jgi:uncharacterized protein (TIGR03437 family)